ncbi:MAG: sigma 54-interacting transcriptional regulator [Planctomycetota bacterium]
MSGPAAAFEASNQHSTSNAFLLVWDGAAWSDVIRLRPGQAVTIGRSTNNRVVLEDESCSRNHCEVFSAAAEWRVRDLGSRNGTVLRGQKITGDVSLSGGDLICIGDCWLGFTLDLDHVPQLPSQARAAALDRATAIAAGAGAASPAPPRPTAGILYSSRTPEFLQSGIQGTAASAVLARLYRLGLQMGAAASRQELAETVLGALTRETVAEIAAVLLVPVQVSGIPSPADLQLTAWHSRDDLPYRRVSDRLSQIVLSSQEAILARDLSGHAQLQQSDSLGQIRAASVICAPVRSNEHLLGLIHLYTRNPDNPLDRSDLEFVLAAAGQLAVALVGLQERASLEQGLARARQMNQQLRAQLGHHQPLIGDSVPMLQLREQLQLIARTDVSVLIRGESGCGKELIARQLHDFSGRSEGPFVCMNCAALSESLLESELFGHEKGAFTGAVDRRAGRFEQADGGTLFLDEVGEMSPAIQAKFLRVLEGHPFERLGGRKPIQVNVRIVAATNRHLEQAVREGLFRQDLYFRLQVAEIHAAPLRDRREDIPLLAAAFLQKFARKIGRRITGFTEDALQKLSRYSWPGNVRELQNTIERTVILCPHEMIDAPDIQLSQLGTSTAPAAVPETHQPENHTPVPGQLSPRQQTDDIARMSLAEVEYAHILRVLELTGGNKSRAAQILGIERSTIDRRLKRAGSGDAADLAGL